MQNSDSLEPNRSFLFPFWRWLKSFDLIYKALLSIIWNSLDISAPFRLSTASRCWLLLLMEGTPDLQGIWNLKNIIPWALTMSYMWTHMSLASTILTNILAVFFQTFFHTWNWETLLKTNIQDPCKVIYRTEKPGYCVSKQSIPWTKWIFILQNGMDQFKKTLNSNKN